MYPFSKVPWDMDNEWGYLQSKLGFCNSSMVLLIVWIKIALNIFSYPLDKNNDWGYPWSWQHQIVNCHFHWEQYIEKHFVNWKIGSLCL